MRSYGVFWWLLQLFGSVQQSEMAKESLNSLRHLILGNKGRNRLSNEPVGVSFDARKFQISETEENYNLIPSYQSWVNKHTAQSRSEVSTKVEKRRRIFTFQIPEPWWWPCFLPWPFGPSTENVSVGKSNVQCGISSELFSFEEDAVSYIVGGSGATPGSIPWQCQMLYGGSHYCGCSLVDVGNANHDMVIVTAAHCVYGVSKRLFKIRLGVNARTDPDKTNGIQVFTVKNILIHEDYSTYGYKHDIAILRLNGDVMLDNTVIPICLADQEATTGEECVVSGWGSTIEENLPEALMKVGVPIVSDLQCASLNGKYFDAQTMVCAGFLEGGKDSCYGDSGGPLFCRRDNVYELAGIVSWGYGCAEQNRPGVYTDVNNYATWVRSKVT